MARNVTVGLIQCATPFDPSWSVEKVKQAGLEKHLPLIEEAGKKGVQILGLQEIFNGPYFCPSQDARWYDAAEAVPVLVDEAHERRCGRSSSAAKKAEAAFKISFARRSSATSRLSRLTSSDSSVVVPGLAPASTSA